MHNLTNMKHLCLVIGLLFVIGTINAQTSFANISFDGPERYTPKTKVKTAAEFRAMKDRIRAFPSRLDYRYDYLNELSNSEDWNRLTDEVVALVSFHMILNIDGFGITNLMRSEMMLKRFCLVPYKIMC